MKIQPEDVTEKSDKFEAHLAMEGLLVGAVGGIVVVAYRFCLEHAESWMQEIVQAAKGNALYMAGWFLVLVILAILVARIITWEPYAASTGVPQLEAEHLSKIHPNWWRVLIAKFSSGVLCTFGGLALGRCSPSVQLGAMAGKGVSKALKRDEDEEEILRTCGASAGMAAIFHAPLAGAIYGLEQIHKSFTMIAFLPALAAAVAADFLVAVFLGTDTIFQLGTVNPFPVQYYGLLLLMGIILGLVAVFYDWIVLKVKALFDSAKKVPTTIKVMIPFLCAGVLGFIHPTLLGGGHGLITELTTGDVLISFMLVVVIVRILFFAISFGSSAPGGIFFPLLVLGAYVGGIFVSVVIEYFGLDPMYFDTFVVLAMGGFFSAVARAPLTGMVLMLELTGSINQLLPLAFISLVAFVIASILEPTPLSNNLRDQLIKKEEQKAKEKETQAGS